MGSVWDWMIRMMTIPTARRLSRRGYYSTAGIRLAGDIILCFVLGLAEKCFFSIDRNEFQLWLHVSSFYRLQGITML